MHEPTLIFLLSLPRAGSTLLQRVIASHPEIATVSEPWLLLPQIFPIHRPEIYTGYRNVDFQAAVEDFFQQLPEGEETYWIEVRSFIKRVYQRISKEKKYFLDKSPRYSLIAQDVSKIFPDEKFVFLFRNPLAIIASINRTWGFGKWKIYTYKADLFLGLVTLLDAYSELRARGNCIAVRYEDLICEPDITMSQVFSYLELNLDETNTLNFRHVFLKGQLGDPKMNSFSRISREPLDSWKKANWNIFRKIWALRYLDWIGTERLSLMGYELDLLKKELIQLPPNPQYLVSDLIHFVLGGIYNFFEPVIFRDKWRLHRTPWKISALR